MYLEKRENFNCLAPPFNITTNDGYNLAFHPDRLPTLLNVSQYISFEIIY